MNLLKIYHVCKHFLLFTITVQDISQAINLNDEEFKNTYGFEKPSYNDRIVVYCRSGKRSEMAQTILQGRGYSNVLNYSGSALDWHGKNL
jgi:rhodanese-related sulfurtransferase